MKSVAMAGLALLLCASTALSQDYRKATEGNEVVMNKLFPKDGKVELNGPNLGLILNSSYVNTFLVNGGINYFFNEVWGIGVEGSFALNSDKDERSCIENFYNDPNQAVALECGPAESLAEDTEGDANFGPAYVNIRELKYIVAANAVWNPIYGKQLLLLSSTSYFDVFVTLGGGLAFSDFYAKTPDLRLSGRKARGAFCTKANAAAGKCDPTDNPGTSDEDEIGINGRPDPVQDSNPLIQFGIGQKYHFFKRFNFKVELRNYTLLGTATGFDNFFTLSGGFGVRF